MTVRHRRAGSHVLSNKTLMFAAAGLPLGVPLEDMLRVVELVDVLPMPLAHPALRGVMPTLEGVSPVYDLARMGSARPAETPRARGAGMPTTEMVALFPHPHGSVGLRVERLAGLADQVEPVVGALHTSLVQALPPGIQPLVTGAATHRRQLFYFFSKDAFLNWAVEEARRLG